MLQLRDSFSTMAICLNQDVGITQKPICLHSKKAICTARYHYDWCYVHRPRPSTLLLSSSVMKCVLLHFILSEC